MQTIESYDVIIVGGGPAGCAFALALAGRMGHRGPRVLMLERWRHPREKYCAGAVSSVGLELLEQWGWSLDVPWVPIDGVRVRYGDRASEHRRERMGVVVRRHEFDHSLWKSAAATGATMHDGERVEGLERDEAGRWIVRTDRGTYRADVVVGADGTGSVVRRLAGFAEHRRKGRLFVVETEPTFEEQGSTTLEFDLSCIADGIQGYYWDFPTVMNGRAAVSRGIYHMNAVPRRDLRRALETMLRRRGFDPGRVRIKGFSERGYARKTRMAARGLLLVGEAAGIDPVTGEGIAQSVVYADVAARACADGLQSGDLRFGGYRRAVERTTMAHHLRQSARLAPHVFGARGPRWASYLAEHPSAVDAGARWYEGRPLGKGEMLRLGASVGWWLARGAELPRPEPLTRAVNGP